jgi:hypothetical protein
VESPVLPVEWIVWNLELLEQRLSDTLRYILVGCIRGLHVEKIGLRRYEGSDPPFQVQIRVTSELSGRWMKAGLERVDLPICVQSIETGNPRRWQYACRLLRG